MKAGNTFLLFFAFIISSLMLTVIQPTISWSLLGWVSLVPFVLACSSAVKTKSLILSSYIIGVCYWVGNLYWIAYVTIPGWLAFCLYTALLWPILAVCIRYCRAKNLPLFLALPILVVGTERLQGLFLGGFFWRYLSHSQYANITLIQIADIFGAAGVSFLVAMVNGLAAELIISAKAGKLIKFSNVLKTAIVCIALISTIFYGRWRINQTEGFIEQGPVLGAVQSNVPQSVKNAGEASESIFEKLLRDSYAAADSGAELIVWPETMVQAIMDEDMWAYLVSDELNRNFHKALIEHSKDRAYILIGSPGGKIKHKDDSSIYLESYNSAFVYTPEGKQAEQKYSKIHLVPFGEVLPFRKSVPVLYNLLMKFAPYDFDYSLDYGSEYTVFNIKSDNSQGHKQYRFSVLICYEDAIAEIARRFALDENGNKRIDWLVNISNDGWFVRFKNGWGSNNTVDPKTGEQSVITPSTELAQHVTICAFRAVENRLAITRSVNAGISCLIDTVGRIRDGYIEGTLPKEAMARTGCSGWFVDTIPIDKRSTFFSKHGQWLDLSCAGCVILMFFTLSMVLFFRNRKYGRISRK